MKLSDLFFTTLVSTVTVTNVSASSVDFKGRVVEGHCWLDFSQSGNIIDLGSITTAESAQKKGYATPLVPFNIQLRDCPAEYPAMSLSFNGEADRADDRLLATGTEEYSSLQGIGIALYDLNTQNTPSPIIVINQGRSTPVVTDRYGNANFHFAAAMIIDGATPVAGESQSEVFVQINYF
jgi:type 1 fimbria pilin